MKFSLINFCFLVVLIHSCYGLAHTNSTKFYGKIENTNESLRLEYGDLLKCNVYDIVRDQTEAGLPLIQKYSPEPIYFPLGSECFEFSVKKRPEPVEIYFEDKNGTVWFKAVLGEFNSTLKTYHSYLFDENNRTIERKTHFKNIFNGTKFDKIWIQVSSVRIGINIGINDGGSLMNCHHIATSNRLTQIGIGSKADKIEYIIHRDPKCYLTPKPVQIAKIFCEEFKSDNSTSNATQHNSILIQKDLYQQIYSDAITFNKTVNGTGNSTSNLYAKRHLTELDDLFAQAKSNHYRIWHSNDAKLIDEYEKSYLYVQIKWQYFNYLKSVLENIKN